MPTQTRAAVWPKENSLADFIPYSAQVDRHTVKTSAGDYLQVVRVDGFAHESADDQDIDIHLDQLNQLFKNIAGPDVALWTHIVRMEENTFPDGEFDSGFASDLNGKYRAHLEKTRMMVNKLYLSVIYRPHPVQVTRLFAKLDKKRPAWELEDDQRAALERINEVAAIAVQSLDKYSPHRLGCYDRNGVLYSEVLEFLGYLVNADWQPFPLPRAPLAHALPTSRPFFGKDVFEVRTPTEEVFGAMLAIKEYPESTEPGLLNALLSSPFPMVLTQSFTFLSRPVALEMLKRQQARMINAGDLAESQIQAITDALDDITAGRYVMGEHHLTLNVFAPSPAALKNNLTAARAVLADCGMVIAREDLAMEAAYWAQLPGNFRFRPRPAPITSRNLAGFASLHNYPSGRRQRNQWGPAVTLLKTSSGAPYYFNFHEPTDKVLREKKEDRGRAGEESGKDEQKALANTVIIGPSGSGKTVVQGFMMAQSQKFKPTMFIFDKDRGLEIFVRAMSGVYSPLENGVPTGFNPFQLPATPQNILFLEALVKKLISGGSIGVQEEKEISDAVRGVMTGLQPAGRRLSSLLAFMDQTNPEGAGARLRRWCAGGPLGWVFDNEADNLDFTGRRMFGFDVTAFLDDAEIRTPIIMYLFHRMESLIDGRRFICFMDEFWKLLLDEQFEDLAQNKLKVIRKQNGFLVFGTQSAADVLKSKISHSIIEQCATMIFMPNPKAGIKDYVDGFKLTNREFQIIREEMLPGSRRFLIKQGHSSVVAELNLQGFDNELAVISGTTDNVGLVSKITERVGDDPAVWLPLFHAQRR
ncbi:VirB4 family type IV secretion/conjugal transfer ATPase [Trichloromonas sp.]|uniref:VirB4 family type IV secretion/conjugal transfer ATPase n=1 Tax=Trichloromonas sp. TaxID=3069249 RepID=UPI002A3BEDCF|nr:VirB4 family type IV secretion/conjugal transfer ATPase [Trichloromonas sp.]